MERKIGRNRGKPRLWLEGKYLEIAGLPYGSRWNLVPQADGFDIVRADDGKRKIAGTASRPIIDISGPRSLGAVAECATVTVTFDDGSGLIRVRKGTDK